MFDFIFSNLLWIIEFIILFSFLIIIHEAGHFFAARWSGVRVHEFALGMGKKLYGKQFGETEYTLNLIPFGGFVRLEGEDAASDDPRSFSKAPLLNRMIITLGGVFVNFVFAIGALTVLFTIGTNPLLISNQDQQAAFEEGFLGFVDPQTQALYSSENQSWSAISEQKNLEPVFLKEVEKPFPESLWFAISESGRISKSIVEKVAEIPGQVMEKYRLPEGMAGPVGIADITRQVSALGFLALVKLAALLSLSLGVMNLLPIPALDGGRFFFQLIELLLKPFGIKPNEKIENYAHVGGFMILMIFLVAVTIEDIVRIFF
jgi:regulator of sigma E protease